MINVRCCCCVCRVHVSVMSIWIHKSRSCSINKQYICHHLLGMFGVLLWGVDFCNILREDGRYQLIKKNLLILLMDASIGDLFTVVVNWNSNMKCTLQKSHIPSALYNGYIYIFYRKNGTHILNCSIVLNWYKRNEIRSFQ